jgi:hypothetical protein
MEREDLFTVIEYAEQAPSVHNTQPWLFSASHGVISIRADRKRELEVLDPQGRELAISCGAAVEFVYLAVRGLGWECDVQLRPVKNDKDLLATLRIGLQRPATAEELALVEAIPRRYTDRGSYDVSVVADDLVSILEHGVSARGAWLRMLDHDGDRLAVIQALAEAESTASADPAYRTELANWVRATAATDGVPLAALGDASPSTNVTDVPLRDFTGADRHPQPGGVGAPPQVNRDTLLMIGTEGDDDVSWLQAGRAMGWLLLRLTVQGLSSQPLGQALDIEVSRQRLTHRLGLLGHIQFLLRTGQGHGQPTTGRLHAGVSIDAVSLD